MEGLNIDGTIDLSLNIEGYGFRAVSCDVEEGLSTTGPVFVEIAMAADHDFEPLLEGLNALGDLRRREPERLGGAREAPALDDGDKRDVLFELTLHAGAL